MIPDGDDVWWAESRPDNGGRTTLVRWRDGSTADITPPEINVRTSVHEYGGGAWWVADGVAYYTEFGDQRLRRVEPGGEPVVLTAEPDVPRALRYADGRPTPDGDWFICVHERHGVAEPVNEIIAVATDGSLQPWWLPPGADFYAAPRVSPDGRSIVWIQWMHPNMPWDATELWIADLDGASVSNARKLVGNGDEALQEPLWCSDGTLVVVTDRDEWWNLYRVDLTTGDADAGGGRAVRDRRAALGVRWRPPRRGRPRLGGDCHGDRLDRRRRSGPRTALHGDRVAPSARDGSFTLVGSSYTASNEVVRVRGGAVEILRAGPRSRFRSRRSCPNPS